MTYEEFSTKQKQILEECRPLVKDLRLDEFNAKMNELIELQDKYLEEQKNRNDDEVIKKLSEM